jgi:hypothetical protein
VVSIDDPLELVRIEMLDELKVKVAADA